MPSDSNSDSSQSDSDESDVDDGADDSKADHDQDADDEDPVPAAATGTYFQTKHEVVETDVIIPNIEEVGPDEELEKVGEVINIIDKAVIIRGIASGISGRGAERALDSDTLLVFEDRKVMGYVRGPPHPLQLLCLTYHPSPDLRNLWPDLSATLPSKIQPSIPPRP